MTTQIALAFAINAGILSLWHLSRGRLTSRREWDAPVCWTSLALLLIAAYCMLATLGVTVGSRLYEGVYAADWGVRIPLTAAAIHNGVPIPNPLYGLEGHTASLRYYYY